MASDKPSGLTVVAENPSCWEAHLFGQDASPSLTVAAYSFCDRGQVTLLWHHPYDFLRFPPAWTFVVVFLIFLAAPFSPVSGWWGW